MQQITKYCQTCRSTQNSTNWDSNRCLKCGNVFNTGGTVAPSASSAVQTFINETVRSGSTQSECLIVQGNAQTGSGSYEKVTYNGRDFFYEKRSS